MNRDRPYIAVVGGSEPSDPAEEAAESVGRGLAERGAVIICGGHGGVMEAVCRGAQEAGGTTTVGLLPDEHRSYGNKHLDIALATGLGEIRNMLVARSADAVIAIEGEFGTLSEIGFALRIGKPVIGLNTWALSTPTGGHDPILRVATPEEAVERAIAAAR
ncbi:MAG: TIGR00725 family protein [Actinomycetota bacterium]|nr:TIGR00725 family protein [Actinomycetota bacterium]